MLDTMRAERFYADSKTIAVEDIPVPDPGPGEVLVKVAFCGICHSDLSLINGTFPAQRPVVTQGHEASGTIAKLGPGVTGWAEGDQVIVAAGRPCTTCPNCRRGDIANCQRIQLMAFAYDGAWDEYTVAQAVGLTRVPDNVPLEQAAILADAVSTPFGAVVRTGQVGIGESVGVWGVGGVGTHIVQLARLVGAAPVTPSTSSPPCWIGHSRWARTTRWTRATPRCGTRLPRSPAAGCSMWRSTRSGSSRRSSRPSIASQLAGASSVWG
jgi:D-arabinose 1-dehydrogenase-like Zn-dependent alcohol dehydrogenase